MGRRMIRPTVLFVVLLLLVGYVVHRYDFFVRVPAKVTVDGKLVRAQVYRGTGGKVAVITGQDWLTQVEVYEPKESDVIVCDVSLLRRVWFLAALADTDNRAVCMPSDEREIPLDLKAGHKTVAFNRGPLRFLKRVEVQF